MKNELIDYKTNLKINKEIIEGLFSNLNGNDKSLLIIKKIREESEIINKKLEITKRENEEFKSKISYYENILNDSIFKQIDNIDILKNKIFLLENAIIKKDNLILNLNTRLNKIMQQEEFADNFVREIYVLEFFYFFLIQKKLIFFIKYLNCTYLRKFFK